MSTSWSTSGPGSPFRVDGDLTLQAVLTVPAQRRRLARQLARHDGWRTLLDLDKGAVTPWLDRHLHRLGTAAVGEALAAVPHHPAVLWGLWIPMAHLVGTLRQTTPRPPHGPGRGAGHRQNHPGAGHGGAGPRLRLFTHRGLH